jgi:hypothetical protein
MLKVISSPKTYNKIFLFCYESIEVCIGRKFPPAGNGCLKMRRLLASSHAGEADPVHGGAHQVLK